MKTISKVMGGNCHLNRSHANPPTSSTKATIRWSKFQHKPNTLKQLLDEQYQLCCYSEVRSDLLGVGSHIEHVQPKSSYPRRTFDYQNLAASALDSVNDLKFFASTAQQVFGGHAKKGIYDPSLFISCHTPGCRHFFSYLSDGRVVAAKNLTDNDRVRADYTITTLQLNSPYLVDLRQKWWDELDELLEEHIIKEWNIDDLVSIEIVPTANKLNQFFSLTRQFFGQVAEQILRQSAPQLL